MGLERLADIGRVAEFLGAPEDDVLQLLEEGRLGEVLVQTMRRRGIPVTPAAKNSVQRVVRAITPDEQNDSPRRDGEGRGSSSATVTIMFTDIVGSIALTEQLGERDAMSVLRSHNEITRRLTSAHGGVEVKTMGDGFMLTFPSARAGVACAVGVQRELAEYNVANPHVKLFVRMGLSVGEPVREQQDLFGRSVVVAARISARAGGEQIYTSQIVHALASGAGEFAFKELGTFELKGISDAQRIYEVL